MKYWEHKLRDDFVSHVESIWEMQNCSSEEFSKVTFVPEVVYELLIFTEPIYVFNLTQQKYFRYMPGIYLAGLLTKSIILYLPPNTTLFGVRLKPFSLAKISHENLSKLNNKIVEINKIFNCLRDISIENKSSNVSMLEFAERIIDRLLNEQSVINNTLRDEMNYMMDSFGNLEISEVHSVFCISKATLRNHFVARVGLGPKDVSKIWRFNNFLRLKLENPSENLTALSIDAGYFDQAHFIKDFQSFICQSPYKFFNQIEENFKITQERIQRRLSSYYSPL